MRKFNRRANLFREKSKFKLRFAKLKFKSLRENLKYRRH